MGPVMAAASVGGIQVRGVAQDVGHLQHAGAQTLADETADAVLLIAHDRKAHHLGAAARHGGTAGQTRQAQRCADGRTGDGKRQRHADQHRNHNAHQSGCSSVAHMMRLPTADATAPMDGANSALRPTPTRIVTAGVTRMSIFVSLLTSLPISAAMMAIR